MTDLRQLLLCTLAACAASKPPPVWVTPATYAGTAPLIINNASLTDGVCTIMVASADDDRTHGWNLRQENWLRPGESIPKRAAGFDAKPSVREIRLRPGRYKLSFRACGDMKAGSSEYFVVDGKRTEFQINDIDGIGPQHVVHQRKRDDKITIVAVEWNQPTARPAYVAPQPAAPAARPPANAPQQACLPKGTVVEWGFHDPCCSDHHENFDGVKDGNRVTFTRCL